MSGEEEGFLNRWSRRKQEAAKEPSEGDASEKNQSLIQASEAAPQPVEEEFDISKLPPVESITAGTDIRAFLSKGVPAALTQAALRRAWSADPSIRDYVGLSEYSWDFNAPGQHGFGAIDPALNVEEMVADIFGKVKQAAKDAEALAEKIDSNASQANSAHVQSVSLGTVEMRSEPEAAERAQPSELRTNEAELGDKSAQPSTASQQLPSQADEIPVPVRRHGSALPT